MNLLMLIIIFLAVVICAAIAFIAWELTREAERERPANQPAQSDAPANDSQKSESTQDR